MTADITGTVTLRVVDINRERDVDGRHPVIMTGVPIHLKPRDTGREDAVLSPSAVQQLGHTGPDGRVVFQVPPGRYDVLAGGETVDAVDVTAGCDLVHEVKLWIGMRLSLSTSAQQD